MKSTLIRCRKSVVVGTMLILGIAVGVATGLAGDKHRTVADADPIGWTWNEGVPGVTVGDRAAVDTMLGSSDVVTAGIRELLSNGRGRTQYAVYASADASGTPCIAVRSPIDIGDFSCLDSRYADYALALYQTSGSSRSDTVERSALLGVARADVARLEVTTAAGDVRQVSLNHWRAFVYTASSAATLPHQLVAYSASGEVLQKVDVSPFVPEAASG